MKNETLTLLGTVSADAAEQACASLKALPGVQDVSFSADPARLHVSLDGATPSRAELTAVLAKAGVLVEAEQRVHASGSCCGGCGS
ncbi:MAG: hypothetical protein Q7U80_05130 [Thiobacillus sp.]|nr:hypothetical protein [Gammaproteobacteria bacterium]MDO9007586.1 hypothetical protein [Thiobacillus sp.]